MPSKYFYSLLSLMTITFLSCKKQDSWLDVKRQNSDVVLTTLKDFQAILDNSGNMNSSYPIIGLYGTDNYYVDDINVNLLTQVRRNSYLWQKDIFEGTKSTDYQGSYYMLANANIVLDGLLKNKENIVERDYVKGQALFFRAISFYNVAQVWCNVFNKLTAESDLGIVLRLTADINKTFQRATVQKTYEQIIADLNEAAILLPNNTNLFKTRPSKAAALSLLAKVYLIMDEYAEAKKYADSALSLNKSLLDFNSNLVSTSSTYRFPTIDKDNPEIIFYATANSNNVISPSTSSTNYGFVDTLLYNSYENSDLRKKYFFALIGNRAKYRGNYTGTSSTFAGLATNELYLLRAECNARLNNISEALFDLNALLRKRYSTGTFTDLNISNPDSLLKVILIERRKELPITAQLRWEDLRRLNKDAKFAITLIRKYNNNIYTLPPNDQRYVYPFSIDEIELAGIVQNER